MTLGKTLLCTFIVQMSWLREHMPGDRALWVSRVVWERKAYPLYVHFGLPGERTSTSQETELYESVELYSKDGLEQAIYQWHWGSLDMFAEVSQETKHLLGDNSESVELYSKDGLEKAICWWHFRKHLHICLSLPGDRASTKKQSYTSQYSCTWKVVL